MIERKKNKIMAAKKNTYRKSDLKAVTPAGKRDSSFFEAVYDVVRQIPKGRVTSYGAVAAALGARSSARMVGWAMNNAHNIKPKVPAHRVVNRQGLLTGKMHFGEPQLMQQLLEKEGVCIKNDQVTDFREKFWDPETELGLV
jgi:methylated-DNA-protein-cysteine methyltransferase related protein